VNGLVEGNVTFTVEYIPIGFANDVVLDANVSSPTSTPEPSSLIMLFGFGLAAVVMYTRRTRALAQFA
jgi:hypothetical protein